MGGALIQIQVHFRHDEQQLYILKIILYVHLPVVNVRTTDICLGK